MVSVSYLGFTRVVSLFQNGSMSVWLFFVVGFFLALMVILFLIKADSWSANLTGRVRRAEWRAHQEKIAEVFQDREPWDQTALALSIKTLMYGRVSIEKPVTRSDPKWFEPNLSQSSTLVDRIALFLKRVGAIEAEDK